MLTISRLAERTGFTASTLRYYEQVGVLAPPSRSPAGYRTYDERAVDRLQFVARAKTLGLPLEAIKELLEAWDGESCASVQSRLRATVHDKQRQTADKITELTAFAGQLDDAARGLSQPAPTGACGPACGCLTENGQGGQGPVDLLLEQRPTAQVPLPVPMACALTGDGQRERLGQWQAVLRAARHRSRVPGGLEFVVPGELALLSQLGDLVLAEQQCCPFLDFVLTFRAGDVRLTITAADDNDGDVVHAMFGAA